MISMIFVSVTSIMGSSVLKIVGRKRVEVRNKEQMAVASALASLRGQQREG